METLPETFVHPAGYCQNVLATGRCPVTGSDVVNGREAILLECDHPRTTELAGRPARLPLDVAVDRATGVILRLVEIDRRRGHPRRPTSSTSRPDAPLPPSAFDFAFPTGTTMLY